MSLYNKASLIQVPSLYKDGLLVSTVPEDRSGDFTVARGSNLSATRIGEDGYIKKGYENLLLQSNSFDTSPWSGNAVPTGGQSGYDGTNDAWLITKTTAFGRVEQFISSSGVHTLSVYAKVYDEQEANTIYFRADLLGKVAGAYFNLSTLSINQPLNLIDSGIESVGNGWYKISIKFEGTTTVVRIYPALGNATNGTTGSIYIQDAQLNQGLVAYPYLETTDATVQGGLLENTPRLDWSNGVPAVLVEEGRTNLITNSEYFGAYVLESGATLDSTLYESPEGLNNAYKLNFTPTGGQITYPIKYIGEHCFSVWLKGDTEGLVGIRAAQGAPSVTKFVNVTTEWQRFNIVVTDGRFWQVFGNSTTLSSVYIYGFQIEEGSTPSSYIPTYGTTQTRSKETVSDTFTIPTTATIYNSFYAPASEQVYILDQVFSVSEGLNKVAIAFSPTAVKISVGGAIVASSTGSYDTTSLTSISLGSDSGADYSNAPISGFYIFPEFLTDDELNSLTA